MIPLNKNKASFQRLSIMHYGVAALFFFLLTILIFLSRDAMDGHYFHPKLLAITHIAVLGWGVMIIFGALYQFLPVISNESLYSKRFALLSFILLCFGTILLAYAFWYFKVGLEMQVAAILIFISFLLFSININLTLIKAKKWNIAADFIQSASVWLIITALIGLLMVINFRFPFLPASHLIYLKVHAHAGIIGWFLLMIVGVASKLLPMFLLSHPPNENKLKAAYWLINTGLLTYIIDYLLLGLKAPAIHLVLIILGIGFFLSTCLFMIKNRMKKVIDWPMKQSITALAFLVIPMILAFSQVFSEVFKEEITLRLSLAYGISIFIGFITALILGQTFKTLPFIVWMYVYKSKDKQTRLLPRDLYSENLVAVMQWVYTPAIATIILGVIFNFKILLNYGAVLLVLASIVYCINVAKILMHILKPKENEISCQFS